MEGRNLVSWPAILGTLGLVVLGLLAWELRWVLLVLFGAVVLAVALDVPVQVLIRRTPLQRPQALVVVVGLLLLLGWELGFLLLPELVQQVATLTATATGGCFPQ
jgi:predicted PurR-regulated permease PerM